jgi:hypothetical protein
MNKKQSAILNLASHIEKWWCETNCSDYGKKLCDLKCSYAFFILAKKSVEAEALKNEHDKDI